MSKYHILYNPISGDGWSDEKENFIKGILADEALRFYDITKISYKSLFENEINDDDNIMIVGGDGTINRFVNDTEGIEFKNTIYYLASGTGNDFMNDIGGDVKTPIQINKYIEKLPEILVNGNRYKFINGIGYGIDGYCCEVGDELRKTTNKPVNYTSIAIKGLLFHYHPVNAVITVDGIKHKYERVWLAPTMNGRYFGGGMMPTPDQDRLNEDNSLSVLVWHGKGKIQTLMAFPNIFKGTHTKYEDTCEILTGHNIIIEFDKPTALQIDGETIKNVLKHEVKSYKCLQESK